MQDRAKSYSKQGFPDQAHHVSQQVMAKRHTLQGELHPGTLSIMNDVAKYLGELGRLEEQAKMVTIP